MSPARVANRTRLADRPISLRSFVEGGSNLLRQGHNEIGTLIAHQAQLTLYSESA